MCARSAVQQAEAVGRYQPDSFRRPGPLRGKPRARAKTRPPVLASEAGRPQPSPSSTSRAFTLRPFTRPEDSRCAASRATLRSTAT